MLDSTLLTTFSEAVQDLYPLAPIDVVARVHGVLLSKIYNARSNEFLHSISKLACIKQKKAVDVNIGLRDKLKCYAAEKLSIVTED